MTAEATAPSDAEFQSTRPVWSATVERGGDVGGMRVSIHAPRMERDFLVSCAGLATACFNPRAPYGARLYYDAGYAFAVHVSIHAPRMERDMSKYKEILSSANVSIHAVIVG